MECTCLYWAVVGCSRLYWAVLVSTGQCWAVLFSTGIYLAVPCSTGIYWPVLGSTVLCGTVLSAQDPQPIQYAFRKNLFLWSKRSNYQDKLRCHAFDRRTNDRTGCLQGNGLHWALLGCSALYWAVLECNGLCWAVLCCTGLHWACTEPALGYIGL